MKIFTVWIFLLTSASLYSQSLKERLQTAITKIETENYIERETNFKKNWINKLYKAGDTATAIRVNSIETGVASVQVDVFKYSIISLKSWWKRLFDIHNGWVIGIHDLALTLAEKEQKLDSAARQKFEEEFKASWEEKEKKSTSFNYRRYFKEKYEKTDSSIKVYEVLYKVDIRAINIEMYPKDTVRIALYQNTLAEVKSSEGMF